MKKTKRKLSSKGPNTSPTKLKKISINTEVSAIDVKSSFGDSFISFQKSTSEYAKTSDCNPITETSSITANESGKLTEISPKILNIFYIYSFLFCSKL
jgi:hypothetical protein